MKFQFDSLQAWFYMDGHGIYVWTAVLLSLAIMIGSVAQALMQHHSVMKEIAQETQRQKNRQRKAVKSRASDASTT